MPRSSDSSGSSSFGRPNRLLHPARAEFHFVRPTAEAERDFTAMAASMTPDLQRFILRFVRGDVHRARDLVQDTLLSAWSHLPDLREPQLLRAWLYRVAYRNTISWLRHRGPRGRPIVTLDPGSDDEIESRPLRDAPLWHVAGDWADSEEMTPRLLSNLAELPPRYAMPLRLHYFESLGLRQTSSVLGISIPTLKMRLHRARELLRRRLTMAKNARRFRSAPGHRGATVGRPPPPPVFPLPPPTPPSHPTPRIDTGVPAIVPVTDAPHGAA